MSAPTRPVPDSRCSSAAQTRQGPRGEGPFASLTVCTAHPGLESVTALKPQNPETHFSPTIALKFWTQRQTPSRLEQQVHFLKKETHFVVREKMPAQEAPAAKRRAPRPAGLRARKEPLCPRPGTVLASAGLSRGLGAGKPSSAEWCQRQARTADRTGMSRVTRRPPRSPLDVRLCCHREVDIPAGLLSP